MRLCKSAESLQNFACQITPQEEIKIRQIGRTGWPRYVVMNVIIFWRNSVWRMHGVLPTSDPCFY
jgi:hypothetical protein